nr:unnamed protein product [Digitaria exilis]
MASSVMPVVLSLLLLVLCRPYAVTASAGQDPCCYKRLFSFGNSFTGPNMPPLVLPYGETFFHHPAGRFCDGRLMALRLPFLTPFLAGKTVNDFRQGANFAVAGGTALSQQFFKDMGLDLTFIPPFSLDVQLECFKLVLHMLGRTEQDQAPSPWRSQHYGEPWRPPYLLANELSLPRS